MIARAHQPADLMRWDIVHGDPYVSYKEADYPEDFKGEGTCIMIYITGVIWHHVTSMVQFCHLVFRMNDFSQIVIQ